MKTQEPIKSFIAVTYGNKPYHFIITDDKKIYCCEFRLEYGADIIELKPNFVLRDEHSQTIYSLKDYLREQKEKKKIDYKKFILETISKEEQEKQQEELIQSYIIEPTVLEYLMENKMLMYSNDMAMLYGFDPQHAYDHHFQTRSFKKSRNKENTKILTKQKKGIFH